MNYDDLLTFLKVVEYGSIVKAAEKLYISQSTASKRIQSLEKELHISLIHRQRGYRKITLTPAGDEFLLIAQQTIALWSDAKNLKNAHLYQRLMITASDSINNFVLTNFYKKYTSLSNNVYLTINTHHPSEIYRLIDNQIYDIGFVVNLYNYANIVAEPLYKENMVLLCHKDHTYYKTKSIDDLHVEDEVYVHWSSDFELWHNAYFNSSRKGITVGTALMQTLFLSNSKTWVITPKTVGVSITKQNTDIKMFDLNSAPKRTCYIIYNKYPKPGIKLPTQNFINHIKEYIKTEFDEIISNI